ncbi:MAG: lipopolysaccharide heptosyltransferase II [Candidatus Nitronauta litoralis]|uniref:lipopolysaccharide heptosyltransferase II n=1 Tax=Candidatus Nitronauta litoralis TaxID=2705533 RepID=A0A7T0BWW4_9BACT|nr:MAG: lipopolysaccharide heptosyltransferase II [Candidatus Nitronauta litoralis]
MEEQAPPKKVQHLLVWMPNWIGDVVFSLPTVQALRKKYPNARITALARPPSNEILVNHPDIDCVIPFPIEKDMGTLGQIRFAFGLRKYHFDLAVLFPNSIRSAWLALFSGATRRLGYETDGRNFLLTDPLPVVKESRSIHGTDYYAGIVKFLGIDEVDKTFPRLISKEDAERNLELMQRLGMKQDKLLIAVSPGASKPEKRWHTERFGILCQKLIKEKKATIVLMGSRKERPLLEQVGRFCRKDKVFIMTGLNLQVVAGFLKNCHLLIANDSGLMNFAAMIDTPVVGIFGPGHPKTTDPLIVPERKELVTLNFECSPCRHKFFKDCEPSPHKKPFCLEDITVTQVADAVESLLNRTN